jgi:NmrA-like family
MATSHSTPLVFLIGGTGSQGIPTVKSLVEDGAYRVRVLTRDTENPRAQALKALNPTHVELVKGTFDSEDDLRAGYKGADYTFVNIDGFNVGEKTEMFWAIRSYELALEEGIKFFVYGNLDYGYKKSGYRPEFRTGHYDGKGRIGEWILQQTKDNSKRMGAALFTSGPYIQMAIAKGTPMAPTIEDGVVTWRVPLGDGAVAHFDVDESGYYVRWLLDHQDRANGLDLEVGIDLINYYDLAKAFTAATNKPAQYIPVTLEEYWTTGAMAARANSPSGYNSNLKDPATLTVKQNFTGFWNTWAASGGNKGVIRRDLKILDEIFPSRTKSAEEWFRKENQRGIDAGVGSLWERVNSLKPFLKVHEDFASGKRMIKSSD